MPRVRPRKRSRWEEQLWIWLETEYPGEFIREFRFHPTRRWRFDFAHGTQLFAIEVEGLLYNRQGAHQTPAGVNRDCTKQAEAMLLGWRVLRVTPQMMRSGEALVYIEKFMRKGRIPRSAKDAPDATWNGVPVV